MPACAICGFASRFSVFPHGRCPRCDLQDRPTHTRARQERLTRGAFPGDEIHSADQRSFIAKQAEGWEVVVEGESDSFHPTREEARVSIRAWKVKREAGTNASNLTEESFLAICKLLSLTPSVPLRQAVKARGVRIVPSTSRYDLLSAGGLDID